MKFNTIFYIGNKQPMTSLLKVFFGLSQIIIIYLIEQHMMKQSRYKQIAAKQQELQKILAKQSGQLEKLQREIEQINQQHDEVVEQLTHDNAVLENQIKLLNSQLVASKITIDKLLQSNKQKQIQIKQLTKEINHGLENSQDRALFANNAVEYINKLKDYHDSTALNQISDIGKILLRFVSTDNYQISSSYEKKIQELSNHFTSTLDGLVDKIQNSLSKDGAWHLREIRDELVKINKQLEGNRDNLIEEVQLIKQASSEQLLVYREEVKNKLTLISTELQRINEQYSIKLSLSKSEIAMLRNQLKSIQESKKNAVAQKDELIEDLTEQLFLITDAYNKNIQIPIEQMKQKIYREIQRVNFEFQKLKDGNAVKSAVKKIEESISKYLNQQHNININLFVEQIEKIQNKMEDNLTRSNSVLSQIQTLVQFISKQSISNIDLRIKMLEQNIQSLRKVEHFQQIAIKYETQRQYIQALEQYSAKLELALKRNGLKSQKVSFIPVFDEYKRVQRLMMEQTGKQLELYKIGNDILLEVKEQILKYHIWIGQLKQNFLMMVEQIKLTNSFREELNQYLQKEQQTKIQIHQSMELFNSTFIKSINIYTSLHEQIKKYSNVNISGLVTFREANQIKLKNSNQIGSKVVQNINLKSSYSSLYEKKKIVEANINQLIQYIKKLAQQCYTLETKNLNQTNLIKKTNECAKISSKVNHLCTSLKTTKQYMVKWLSKFKYSVILFFEEEHNKIKRQNQKISATLKQLNIGKMIDEINHYVDSKSEHKDHLSNINQQLMLQIGDQLKIITLENSFLKQIIMKNNIELQKQMYD